MGGILWDLGPSLATLIVIHETGKRDKGKGISGQFRFLCFGTGFNHLWPPPGFKREPVTFIRDSEEETIPEETTLQ